MFSPRGTWQYDLPSPLRDTVIQCGATWTEKSAPIIKMVKAFFFASAAVVLINILTSLVISILRL